LTDFENKPLNIGDSVIVAFNQFKTTKLKRGIVIKTDIKQAGMTMALININDKEKRVAHWNIHKVETKLDND